MSGIDFSGRVAIVTGAGGGLGREYALELARRNAKVVVNDIGGAVDGTGTSDAAEKVVEEIRSAGGTAIANGGSVTDMGAMNAMARQAIDEFGRVDILIANAGILRDKSFRKMPIEDYDAVVGVHLLGTARSIKAVWDAMCDSGYGRIIVTTSTAGLLGNFGQSNYGSAKFGMIGLMNVLRIEGEKFGVRINCISPFAATRMSENLMTQDAKARMRPQYVAPGVAFLASEDSPNGVILNAGAGVFSVMRVTETFGASFSRASLTAEDVQQNWDRISSPDGARAFANAQEHGAAFAERMPAD